MSSNLISHLRKNPWWRPFSRIASDFYVSSYTLAVDAAGVAVTLRRDGSMWEISACRIGSGKWTDFEEVQTTDDVYAIVDSL